MGDLALDTRLVRTEPTGEDAVTRFRAELSADWKIWGPNGGYLAALALRARGEVAPVKRPASIACHFLSVADFAPVDVETRINRAGRISESISVSIRQAGKPIVEAMIRTTDNKSIRRA